MPDYRLDGLSTRTFEHVVQSLAVDAIVTTVTPFGDGPDGGREATFSGLTHYGPACDPWKGYGVVQAKFLQRPKTPQQDGTWIVNELKKELKKFGSTVKTRHLDYYILATNVTLTAVADSGTKDKVIEVLADFAEANDLKGFDIWDYDKLRTLLDNNEAVRKSYAAWITTGDVLMQLSDWLAGHRPDFHRLVVNYLQKELLSDQFARLEQAGHTADEAIPLAQVFVDLPFSPDSRASENSTHSSQRLPNFVEFIAVESEAVLAPCANDDEIDHPRRPVPGRFVLIGGPGQGKTTLGQYVCQVFRSALLKDVPRTALDPEARQVMQAFEVRDGDSLPAPAARRLPLRIVLSDFAAALAGGQTHSLLAYLTSMFCKRTNSDLTAHQFQALITEYPTILVLDGLDEVPASSNRDQVLRAVQDFSVDIASGGMDVLIIATSRPQGYNEDFSPSAYKHLWLAGLSAQKALEYGEKLAKVRFVGNPDRLDKIIGRLRLAARAPATARIMRSPLQVTILTLLVDRRGQLPQEKWALFDEYYSLIYQRETERDIPAAAILRERKDDIDAVHRLAGLLLQVECEASGSTDAKLTTEQFGNLVDTYLRAEGHEGTELCSLRQAIIEGAATRLVFLVGLESGQVGFEIRSLQEFMAAEGLLDAPDDRVQNRLRCVARSANWRNVTVFAAGKIFAERRYLRDTVDAMCLELNDDHADRALTLTYAGSELALDLLEDGPVTRHPTKSRSLIRVALRLLRLPGRDFARRLAGVYQDSMTDVFREELALAFDHDPQSRANAWLCLDSLIEQGVSGFDELARSELHRDAPDVPTTAEILTAASIPLHGWRAELAELVLPGMDPNELRRFGGKNIREPLDQTAMIKHWRDAAVEAVTWRPPRAGRPTPIFPEQGEKRIVGEATINFFPYHDYPPSPLVSDVPEPVHPGWRVVQAIERFDRAPSKEALAAVIRAFAQCSPSSARHILSRGSGWPIDECRLAIAEGADAGLLATAAETGALGDATDWGTWQTEWLEGPLRITELGGDLLQVAQGDRQGRWFPRRCGELKLAPSLTRAGEPLSGLLSLKSPSINQSLVSGALGERHWSRASRSTLDSQLTTALMELLRSGAWPMVGFFIATGRWHPPVEESWAEAMAMGIRGGGRVAAVQARVGSRLSTWLWSAFQRFPHLDDLIAGMSQITSFTESVPTAFGMMAGLDFSGNPAAALGRGVIGLRSGASLDAVWNDITLAFSDASSDVRGVFDALTIDRHAPDIQVASLLRVYDLSAGSAVRRRMAIAALRRSLRSRRSELLDRGRWLELGFDPDARELIGRNAR